MFFFACNTLHSGFHKGGVVSVVNRSFFKKLLRSFVVLEEGWTYCVCVFVKDFMFSETIYVREVSVSSRR